MRTRFFFMSMFLAVVERQQGRRMTEARPLLSRPSPSEVAPCSLPPSLLPPSRLSSYSTTCLTPSGRLIRSVSRSGASSTSRSTLSRAAAAMPRSISRRRVSPGRRPASLSVRRPSGLAASASKGDLLTGSFRPDSDPSVIVIHGGAWVTSGLRQLPAQQVDYLLARSLAVVDIEYRLVSPCLS